MSKRKPRSKAPAKDADQLRLEAMRRRSSVERRAPAPLAAAPDYPLGRDRRKLKGVAIYMHPLAKETLKRISRSEGKSLQDLGIEALNLLFRKYGEKPIA